MINNDQKKILCTVSHLLQLSGFGSRVYSAHDIPRYISIPKVIKRNYCKAWKISSWLSFCWSQNKIHTEPQQRDRFRPFPFCIKQNSCSYHGTAGDKPPQSHRHCRMPCCDIFLPTTLQQHLVGNCWFKICIPITLAHWPDAGKAPETGQCCAIFKGTCTKNSLLYSQPLKQVRRYFFLIFFNSINCNFTTCVKSFAKTVLMRRNENTSTI